MDCGCNAYFAMANFRDVVSSSECMVNGNLATLLPRLQLEVKF
jgi:hypothetical protein